VQAYFANCAVLPQPGKQGTIFALGSHDLALDLLADHLAQDAATPNLIALSVGSLARYTQEVSTHSQVADVVLQGGADFGLGVLAAARKSELDFSPLYEERFDLVIPDEHFQNPMLTTALEIIHDMSFQKVVSALGGMILLTWERIFPFNPFIVQGAIQ
jgi:DNA-binding transcriptional LysR family regulator